MKIPLIGSAAILASWVLVPPGELNVVIEGILLLAFTAILVIRARHSVAAFLVAVFLAHTVYSIVLPFYLLVERFPFPLTEAITPQTSGIGLRLLWFLPLTVWPLTSRSTPTVQKDAQGSPVVFWGALVSLLYIAVFAIDRVGGSGYVVRTSPLFEYSYLLVLPAYYFMGRSRFHLGLLLLVCAAIAIQDVYYGGRVTTFQIVFVLALTAFRHVLTTTRIVAMTIAGIVGASWVGATRGRNVTDAPLILVEIIRDDLLVSDTAQYSYYASLTHVAAAGVASTSERAANLGNFLLQILTGGRESLTSYVSNNYFVNVGGGVFVSHFYFWGGLLAVAIGTLMFGEIIRMLVSVQSPTAVMLLTLIVSSSPRWILYTPAAAIRPLLLLSVLLMLMRMFGYQLAPISTAPSPRGQSAHPSQRTEARKES